MTVASVFVSASAEGPVRSRTVVAFAPWTASAEETASERCETAPGTDAGSADAARVVTEKTGSASRSPEALRAVTR